MNPDEQIWSYTKRTGFLALFGLPFFLAGCFFFYMALTTPTINNAPADPIERAGLCIFSSMFILIGLAIIAGVKRVSVDAQKKTIKTGTGIFIPFLNKKTPFSEARRVYLKKEVRVSSNSDGGSNTKTVYPVYLYAPNKLSLHEFSNPIKARRVAEGLAKHLEVKFEDSSRGKSITRTHDELDMSIYEREQKVQTVSSKPENPDDSIEITEDFLHEEGEQVFSITLPPAAYKTKGILMVMSAVFLTCLIIVLSKIIIVLLNDLDSGLSLIFNFLEFFFIVPLIAVLGVGKLLLRGLSAVKITIFEHQLKIKSSFLGLKRTRTIPSKEIEELELHIINKKADTASISLVTDHMQLTLGKYQSIKGLQFVINSILWRVKS